MQLVTYAFAALLASFAPNVLAVYYPRVAVSAPAANDIWLTGDVVRIEWQNITPEGIDFPPTTHIRLKSLDNATFVHDIANDVRTDTFAYNWTVPTWLPNNDAYYIRLLPQRENPYREDGSRLPNIVSSNSRPFLIVGGKGDLNQLAFLQPTLGAVWHGGEIRYIQWTFEDATIDAIISILLENKKELTAPFVIASQIPAVPGAQNVVGFRWQVPTSLPNSSQYTLRIDEEACTHMGKVTGFDVVAQYTAEGNKPPVSSIGPKFTISQQKA